MCTEGVCLPPVRVVFSGLARRKVGRRRLVFRFFHGCVYVLPSGARIAYRVHDNVQ